MNKSIVDDFGFSLVSEEELKAYEQTLKKQVEEKSAVVEQTTTDYENKIAGIMNMITPLLDNLAKEPDKEYILWPDRSKKVIEFKKRLQEYVQS